jgi:hypothetical protein
VVNDDHASARLGSSIRRVVVWHRPCGVAPATAARVVGAAAVVAATGAALAHTGGIEGVAAGGVGVAGGVVFGVDIGVLVAGVRRVGGTRVAGQEAACRRVVIAGMEIDEAGLGVRLGAGEADGRRRARLRGGVVLDSSSAILDDGQDSIVIVSDPIQRLASGRATNYGGWRSLK